MSTWEETGVKNDFFPPFAQFDGQTSFFGGQSPLPVSVGYIVVLGFVSSFLLSQDIFDSLSLLTLICVGCLFQYRDNIHRPVGQEVRKADGDDQ
jgi:hypothetical protein